MHTRDFQDITVVVQGPVQTLRDRQQDEGITARCLNSVRKHLPGATIILSTWPDQDLTGLDYDELVVCQDPGANIRFYFDDLKPAKFNNNRQIVSTLEGLERVKTRYAMKLRSDNFLTNNHFVELQKSFNRKGKHYRFLEERVVVCNIFTRRYAKGYPVAFHLSDFFYFGLTIDLLKIWDIPLFEDLPIEKADDRHLLPGGWPIDCTQLFWLTTVRKFYPEIESNALVDPNPTLLEASDQIYANNLVIASADEVGLGLCSKFLGNARISRTSGKCAQWQFFEWQSIYQKYCDPAFIPAVSLTSRVILWLNRLIHVKPYRLESVLKIAKKRFIQKKVVLFK